MFIRAVRARIYGYDRLMDVCTDVPAREMAFLLPSPQMSRQEGGAVVDGTGGGVAWCFVAAITCLC